MRELKILLVLILFTGITYWGVEPLAHTVMHPHVESADYEFKDCKILPKGNAQNGKELIVQNCTACHGIKSDNIPTPMDSATASSSYGVVPPDLSSAGALYNEAYLGEFIANPVKASHVEHKYADGSKTHPMPNYDFLGEQGIADVVAYLKSIQVSLTAKEAFEEACVRCHSMKYANITSLTDNVNIKKYMGTLPPDLSMMFKSRGKDYLHNFINDPQKLLHGTSMPRVGLSENAEKQVVSYMENIADAKKEQREELGPKVLIYMAIFAFLAYLWKRRIWSRY